jgi:hypothetical protein
MGRYYSGDINGKFWFAVQSSDAADRFGVVSQEPNYINYYFEKENLPEVQEEIATIKQNLGDYLPKLEQFFSERDGYTHEALAEYLGVEYITARFLLSEYADLDLGLKIEKAILEDGQCYFEAEV